MKQLNPKPRCPEFSPEFVTLLPRRKNCLGTIHGPSSFVHTDTNLTLGLRVNPRAGHLWWGPFWDVLVPGLGALLRIWAAQCWPLVLHLEKKTVSLTTNLHLRKTEMWQELPPMVWIKWVNVCFDSIWQTELAELLTGHIWSKFL